MLTFQLTVSIALIAVVMLIFKQIQHVKHHDLGFNKEQLVRIELPNFENQETLKKEVSNLPFVTDRKSTRLNSSHVRISYAVFCLKKKKKKLKYHTNTT